MSLPEVPYWGRFLGLLVVLALGAAIDRWRRGEKATRPREYLFLLSCGFLGAAFAIGVDHVDCTISPDYFVHGKGLDDEHPRFRWYVTELGFRAGFLAGLVVGGLLLVANQPSPARTPLRERQLVPALAWPLGLALALAPLGALVTPRWDFMGYRAFFTRARVRHLDRERAIRVGGIHLGLYAGGALGTLIACVRVRRRSA